jgi:hypothetical protein
MKTNPKAFLRSLLAILVMAGGGAALDARADVSASANAGLEIGHYDDGFQLQIDFNSDSSTQATFSVSDSFRLEWYANFGGAYSYYDLERNFDGSNVTYAMRIADAHINTPFANDEKGAICEGSQEVSIREDMMLVYFPSSATDTPPTQVSFQVSYSVQGQIFLDNTNAGAAIYAQPFTDGGNDFTIYKSSFAIPINSQVLSDVFTESLNTKFQVQYFLSGGSDEWGHGEPTSTADVRLIPNGFVNVVDQNGQSFPPGKVVFEYYNENNPNESIAVPNPANLAGTPPVLLSANLGTNGLVIQWPSYVTNYQLETTTNLVNASWTTNSLLTPMVSGPFLQVNVPTTNAAAFFRLQSQ